MDEIYMNASTCVVVSGLPGLVNSQKLREHFETADSNSGIRQLVTFSKIGVALIEFLTPDGVRRRSAEKRGTVAGRHQVSNRNLAEADMVSDACLVVSGFPDDGSPYAFSPWTKHLLIFQEIGTALAEFSSPEEAAEILANKFRLLEETGLQVRKLETLLCPKESVTSQHTQVPQLQQQLQTAKQNLKSKEQQLKTAKQNLNSKEQQLETVKQNLNSKEQQLKTAKQNLNSKEQQLETVKQNLNSKEEQLQQVTTVNKSLQAALSREREAQKISINLSRRLEQENSHLKEQISAYTSGSYEMTSDPRGVAVIINNIRFEDMAERHGAERDTDRLREVFESIGFTVVTFTDLDHAKMVAAMKDQGKADHSNHDCFVCCIMSHGTMGKVFSSDDVGIDICELMKPVNAKKCPSLKGKPKLFFIQACQGEKTQGRESFDGNHDAKPVPFICHEADFFLGLATVPGYVALRDPEDGAPYVKHLAKLLKDFGPTHDLSAIMAMVCDKMNEVDAEKCGWISSNHSTLRKNLIFKPK
ncbi:Casp10p [Branchiostoma belcheri]|nr:Casp10p [Branchiostoma belcheri]